MSDIANIPGSPASSGAYRVAGWEHLGRVLVLGLGKSGKSVARYCAGLIDGRVDSSLSFLYDTYPGTRDLAGRAAGVLVMPVVTEVGLGLGGSYGTGALRVGESNVDY